MRWLHTKPDIRLFITAVCSIIILNCLWYTSHTFHGTDNIVEDSMVIGNHVRHCHFAKEDGDYNTAMDFLKRLSNLQYHCKMQVHNNTDKLPQLDIARKNNLKYCKVTKCGSTFWMSVFIIIDQNNDLKSPFGTIRKNIHMKGSMFLNDTNLTKLSGSDVVFFVARDPFSRLYSAFIDRIFLPAHWHAVPHISVDNTPVCDKRNTFSVLVEFIIRSSKVKDTALDEYWRPTSELCTPCRIPYNFIVKQETFKRDVEFLINQTNINDSQRKTILEGLQEKHDNYSMQEVIKVQASFGQKANQSCMSFDDFTRRLWQAFQIQGYISDSIPFPEEKFVGLNYSSVKAIEELYLHGANQFKLSDVQKLIQRNRYLRQAYKTISNDSLQRLLEIYGSDFRLLGYSSVPPHLRPV